MLALIVAFAAVGYAQDPPAPPPAFAPAVPTTMTQFTEPGPAPQYTEQPYFDLDAYLEEDHIQFVANTVDPNSGLAVVYHGIIDDVNAPSGVRGKILTYGDHELGYPDISYAGTIDGDQHSFIVASHVSTTRFPGHSVLEFDGTEYSPWVTLAEGETHIARIGGIVQRWGALPE